MEIHDIRIQLREIYLTLLNCRNLNLFDHEIMKDLNVKLKVLFTRPLWPGFSCSWNIWSSLSPGMNALSKRL